MAKTPSDTPSNPPPAMTTPRPPPPPQPGEKEGMITREMRKATPVPAINVRPPAPASVDGAPPRVGDAPVDSNGSATLLSPGTHADDGFAAPCGKTAPFHAAVPMKFIPPRVITGNSFSVLEEARAVLPWIQPRQRDIFRRLTALPKPPSTPSSKNFARARRPTNDALMRNLMLASLLFSQTSKPR
jgi:hypothetical protein